MKAGFIGLGIMGKPMAMNILKAGKELMVYDLNEEIVAELVGLGATKATIEEIGTECDAVFTILPNAGIVQNVLFGEGGVAEYMAKDGSAASRGGAVVCDMSSVTPGDSRFCYDKLKEIGVGFVDSPVSGGEPKAIDGTLAFMAGGDEKDFDALKEYFDAMGSSAMLVGPSGNGSIAKLANQIIVNLNIAAVSEAFVLATKAGADPEKVYQAIRGGLAGSTVMDAKVPMILDRNFKPGGTITVNHKDIKNVMATAHAEDVPLPLTSQLFEIMQALRVSGHTGDDHSGIVQYFEQLADIQVKRPEE